MEERQEMMRQADEMKKSFQEKLLSDDSLYTQQELIEVAMKAFNDGKRESKEGERSAREWIHAAYPALFIKSKRVSA